MNDIIAKINININKLLKPNSFAINAPVIAATPVIIA